MATSLEVFRALHLLFAISWAGAAIYRASVVGGAMRRDLDFTARFYANAMHGPFMGVTAIGTVLFGGAVLGAADGAFGSEALATGPFVVLYAAVTAGTLAFILGLAGHMPLDRKLMPLARHRIDGQEHDEVAYNRLVAREHALSRISVALIAIAMVGMTTYRLAG